MKFCYQFNTIGQSGGVWLITSTITVSMFCQIVDILKPPHAGQEPINWKSKELLGRIGMVFQEPEHQFASNFVRDEVAIGHN